jgi:alkanesulfonate monooxygenase SsuD/methylene tetrahydromethanopterin reductase-like flavin-dependent oxidoreductase (luciferase family)
VISILKFILQAGNWYQDWKNIENSVPEADKVGFWGFVMPDHYMWGPDRGGDSTLETWVTLTFLAARTENLHLGTLVTPIPFRPPGMLAKEVTTLDVISGGRALLGVGAGWSETEFQGYSVWDSPKVRVDKTLEGLQLMWKLWTSKDKVDWKGKYYSSSGAILEPKPIQSPHPPLLFGGGGTRMLKMAGKYADICLIPPWARTGVEDAKRLVVDTAKKSSREDKVSFASLVFSRERYDPSEVSNMIGRAKDEGCEYYIIGFPRQKYLESLKSFTKEIMPSFS